MLWTRRQVVAGAAALAATPAVAQVPPLAEVIVVGAGIAGIAAARHLFAQDVSVVVLEARNRVGGRAFTEASTFGVPYDHGPMFVHSAEENPFATLVTNLGHELVEEGEFLLYADGKEAGIADYDELGALLDRIDRQILDAAGDGRDVAAASVVDVRGKWAPLAKGLISDIGSGVPLGRLSTADYAARFGESGDALVAAGIGTVVSSFAEDLPIVTGAPVTRITWSGRTVSVTTDRGTIEGRVVVLTVPTGVLAEDGIRFDPPLPSWKRTAIEQVPMGLLDKVTLQLRQPLPGIGRNTAINYPARDGEVMSFLVHPHGAPLVVGFVGGGFARSLEKQGAEAAVAFARERVGAVFGSETAKTVVKGDMTRWGADPWARGAFSAARPGQFTARRLLAEPVDRRLYFAGEATVPEWSGQLAGGYLSGVRAAKRVIAERA